MLYPCRPVKQTTTRRKKRKRHPNEKPINQQWCLAHADPGVFVCGRCKKPFIERYLAKLHRRTCEGRFQRELEGFANSLKDRRTPAQKRRETRILLGLQVYGRQGRPRHLHYKCKHCSKDLSSA
jgi:DNA-directed RNA polymerase subunit RPC12/RpoP